MKVRKRRTASAAAAALGGAIAVSGCGVQTLSSYNAAHSTAASGAMVRQAAPQGEKAADVIDAIRPVERLAKRVPESVRGDGLQLSTSVGYPPMEIYGGPDKKNVLGVDPAMGLAIARVLGVAVHVSDADFNAQIPGVLTGRYDMVMSSMSDTPERQKKVTFVDYVSAGAGYLVNKGNPDHINDPDDMCGRTVSVVDNGSSLDLAKKYSTQCVAQGKPKIKLLRMIGDSEALLALKSGRAQATITDYVVAASKASDPKEAVEATALEGTESPWGIAMNPKDKQLISLVQKALDHLIRTGDYAEILKAWHVDALALDKATINGAKS